MPILTTSYTDPDLDGIGCMVGYAEFLNWQSVEAVAGIIGEPHKEAKFIFDTFGFEYPQLLKNANDYKEVVILDASDLNGLAGNVDPLSVVEVIDHRKVTEVEKFPNAKIQLELVGAAATLIAEKFMFEDAPISKAAATLLYGAILSNTLNFKATVTTDRDRVAAEWLNKIAQLPPEYWRDQFMAKSDLEGEKLAVHIEHDYAWFNIKGKKYGIAQLEIMGGSKVVAERLEDILVALNNRKNILGLDLIFLNLISLDEDKNYLVTDDLEVQKLLEKILQVKFDGTVAERPGFIMRKQIRALMAAELE